LAASQEGLSSASKYVSKSPFFNHGVTDDISQITLNIDIAESFVANPNIMHTVGS
jgi:hypothetical protein